MTFSAHARARARRFAMQALYQWDLSGTDLPLIRKQFLVNEDFSKADQPYFMELLTALPKQTDVIDRHITDLIDRPFEQLNPVERAILRIAVYELLERMDVPYRVVINEAVQLAKKFGAEQGHAFVNGVLDKAAGVLRTREYRKASGQTAGR
ncbi:MAG TPA: transcription antitermination factor NusB [Gammaproteobacteria bacterium]|jgi:N utilization substance protein B|nr:transcription antitermination factor NusB [Gammaproteobacteria bacterium]